MTDSLIGCFYSITACTVLRRWNWRSHSRHQQYQLNRLNNFLLVCNETASTNTTNKITQNTLYGQKMTLTMIINW